MFQIPLVVLILNKKKYECFESFMKYNNNSLRFAYFIKINKWCISQKSNLETDFDYSWILIFNLRKAKV